MRGFLLFLTVLVLTSQLSAQSKNMKIEFLGMDDCPNTPPMWISLQAALTELKWTQPIEKLDIVALSKKQDRRAGFGSPTILVNGRDLFGSPFPGSYNPSCRYYRGGLPTAKLIVDALKSLAQKQSGVAQHIA